MIEKHSNFTTLAIYQAITLYLTPSRSTNYVVSYIIMIDMFQEFAITQPASNPDIMACIII